MGLPRIKANDCEKKEKDWRLKEQFINGINNDNIITDIIQELTAVKKTSEITNEHKLAWTRITEAKRA